MTPKRGLDNVFILPGERKKRTRHTLAVLFFPSRGTLPQTGPCIRRLSVKISTDAPPVNASCVGISDAMFALMCAPKLNVNIPRGGVLTQLFINSGAREVKCLWARDNALSGAAKVFWV